MNRRKKLILLSSIVIFIVLGVSAILMEAHTLKPVDHNEKIKLTDHGMTTTLRSSQFNKTGISTSQERIMVRISFNSIEQEFYQALYHKIKRMNGVKEVYQYLTAKNDYGEILGIDVDKDFLFIHEEVSVVPKSIEGRLLSRKDDGELVMMVNETFAKNYKTEEGKMILGSLAYHPKSFRLGKDKVSVVGIVSPVSRNKNVMVMPFTTAEKLLVREKESPSYELYIWVKQKAQTDQIVQKVKKEMANLNDFQIQVIESKTTKLFHH